MNSWFRFYECALDDPKVQLLSGDHFKFWMNCLCLAARNEGYLPPIESVSFAFRMSLFQTKEYMQVLRDSGLIDERRGLLTPHNWHKRQYLSDSSTPRVKRYRKRFKTVTETLSVTPPDTDTEQTQIQTQNRSDTEGEKRAHGEFASVQLSAKEIGKLEERLNGYHRAYIDRLDRYSQSNPLAFRRYKSHYAVLMNWYDRDIRDGKIFASPAIPAFEWRDGHHRCTACKPPHDWQEEGNPINWSHVEIMVCPKVTAAMKAAIGVTQ